MNNFLTYREEGNVVVVDVGGNLTSGSAPLRMLLQELAEAGYMNILVNMAAVTCIDRTTVEELAASRWSLARVDGALKLLSLQEPVKDVFRATRLDSVFEIFEAESDAILSFYWPNLQQLEEPLRIDLPAEVI